MAITQSGSVTFPLTYIGSDNVMGGYIGCSQLAMADILGTGAKMYIQNVRRGHQHHRPARGGLSGGRRGF